MIKEPSVAFELAKRITVFENRLNELRLDITIKKIRINPEYYVHLCGSPESQFLIKTSTKWNEKPTFMGISLEVDQDIKEGIRFEIQENFT